MINLRASRREHRERGATLVEFSMVMPILLLLVLGVMEFGMAFYDYLTVEQATREGARVAALAGTSADADCQAIQGIVDFVPGSFIDRLEKIEIYHADADGDPIPGQTNIWRPTAFDPTDCLNWMVVETWPSSARQTKVGSVDLDIVGVRIVMDRSWISGFPPFRGDYTLDEWSILRLEPEAYQ